MYSYLGPKNSKVCFFTCLNKSLKGLFSSKRKGMLVLISNEVFAYLTAIPWEKSA